MSEEEYPRIIAFNAFNGKWMTFEGLRCIIQTSTRSEVTQKLKELTQIQREANAFLVGFLSYEIASTFDLSLKTKPNLAHVPLLWYAVFTKVNYLEQLPEPEISLNIQELDWTPDISRKAFGKQFNRIKNSIFEGDTYQVNYTFRLESSFTGSPYALFWNLARNQTSPYHAFIETAEWAVCAASPELFFIKDGDRLMSKPMKGTAKRGRSTIEDIKQENTLHSSTKDRAENLMIVDMMRNDFSLVADKNSVHVDKLFDVEKYETVWQMTSTVSCDTRQSVFEILEAIFPPASITGAPKSSTMEIIAQLEKQPRGIYTGTIGIVYPDNKAQFNVAIRTVWIDKIDQIGTYGVGSGIVWDSQEQQEWEECLAKTAILHRELLPAFKLFETIKWTPKEGFFVLEEHLERISNSATFFDYQFEETDFIQALEKCVVGEIKSQKIKILLDSLGNIEIEKAVLRIDEKRKYRVTLAKNPVSTSNVFLYHKTTHRKIYEEALNDNPEYDDVILYNERGEITETTIGNIIVVENGKWKTPPISSGLLGGTYRARLLKEEKVREEVIYLNAIKDKKVYMINAIRGLVELDLYV